MRLLFIRRGKSVLKDADQRVSVIKFKGRGKKVGEGVFVLEKSGGNGVGNGNSPLKRHLQKFESAYSNLGQFGSCMTATKKRLNNNYKKALKKTRAATVGHSRVFFFCLFIAGAWFPEEWPSCSELQSWVHQDRGKELYPRGLREVLAWSIYPAATFCATA